MNLTMLWVMFCSNFVSLSDYLSIIIHTSDNISQAGAVVQVTLKSRA